ncbi:MAG TPA: hypothetical protein VJ464_14420 [Blastocatellia bacterium]|nr:hypothetical protein [Blastocatellia bacterium]
MSGAKGDNPKSSEVKPETLVGAIAAVFIFGLGAIIFLAMAMKMVFGADNPGLIIFFTLFSFLIMLGVESAFIWMLLGRKKGAKEADDTKRLKKQTAKALDEARAGMLAEPAFSVTEHTTRTLEPVEVKHTAE